MRLDETLARKIVARSMKIIAFSVNVMDHHGVIIASGDPARLQQRHDGALLVLHENRVVEIDQEAAQRLQGARPGINLPITFQGELLGVIGISGDPEQVRAYAELVQMTAELILEQAALSEQLQWDRRHREELLLTLIRGETLPPQLAQTAQLLKIDLQLPRVAIVIRLDGEESARLRELVLLLEESEESALVAINGLDEVVLLKPLRHLREDFALEVAPFRQLAARLSGFKLKIAVGGYFPEVEGLAHSFQTAQATLNYGLRHAPRRTLLFFDEHRLAVLLGTFANSWQAEQLLAPLQRLHQGDKRGLLRKTLETFFLQNCDLTHTAEQLFIHPNTLRYRISKIENITGLSFNKIEDKLLLYLALSLSR